MFSHSVVFAAGFAVFGFMLAMMIRRGGIILKASLPN
jgi:hypothetical protein